MKKNIIKIKIKNILRKGGVTICYTHETCNRWIMKKIRKRAGRYSEIYEG